MNISKRSANYIVQEISKIIGERINMMNGDGIIIASNDIGRIGSFHAAAKELIDQKLQEVVVKNESEYEGAHPGLNLAINFQQEIVGVIGVTGPYEEVAKYGHIIKKMTEILLLDQYYKEQQDIDKRIRERYLDQWMFGETKHITPQFIKQGSSMQIDITLPRRIMAISYKTIKGLEAAEEQKVIDSAEQTIRNIMMDIKNSCFLKTATEFICAVPDCSDDDILRLAEQMKLEVEGRYPLMFCCGIDTGCEGYIFIHNNILKAMKALKTSLRSPQKGIRLYTSITMEIFQSELSENIKREYIIRVFRDSNIEEIDRWIQLLNVFYEEEGSVNAAAQRLHMHKNTLQYRLNKIRERTGYDPRSIRYSSLFYNAIHFYQDISSGLY